MHGLVTRSAILMTVALILTGCATTHPGTDAAGSPASTPAPTAAAAGRPGASAHARPRAHQHARSTGTAPSSAKVTTRVAPAGSYDDTSGITAKAPRDQSVVLAHLPGSAGSTCVKVGAQHSVRSGAVAMGDFAAARATYRKVKGAYDAAPSNLYVIPTSRTVGAVSVTLTRVGGGAAPITVRTHLASDAAQWRFFPFTVKLTRPGTWRFTVSAGDEHGCFEATFRA